MNKDSTARGSIEAKTLILDRDPSAGSPEGFLSTFTNFCLGGGCFFLFFLRLFLGGGGGAFLAGTLLDKERLLGADILV